MNRSFTTLFLVGESCLLALNRLCDQSQHGRQAGEFRELVRCDPFCQLAPGGALGLAGFPHWSTAAIASISSLSIGVTLMRQTIARVSMLVALVTFLIDCQLVSAQTVVIPHSDRGWYAETGFHNPSNSNYVVGDSRTFLFAPADSAIFLCLTCRVSLNR